MRNYEIPRNYRGEGRILYIFSKKGLIYTCVGAGIGLIFFFTLKSLGYTMVGLIITVILGAIGFAIGSLKMPETTAFEITRKTGGENIDDIILRWIKFKKNKNKIYVYKAEEETKDGQ